MSYFGLSSANQEQQLETASSNPVGVKSDVGFFSNAVGAAASGLYTGLVAKPEQALWAGVDAVVSPVARFVNENTSINDTSEQYIRQQRTLAESQVRRLTPDPSTTGMAGMVLNGLFDMGSQAVLATLAGGPAVAAAAVTGFQGFSEFERLRKDGVDVGTAQDVALIHGVTAGAGTLLPMSIGLRAGGLLAEGVGAQLVRGGENAVRNAAASVARASPDIAYAAGTNVAFGMAQRGLTASTLRSNGYEDMAKQYDVFDRQSLAIDAVLGVAFGGLGRFINARNESVRPPEFAPAEVDAALSANAAQHAEFDVAPGIPVNVLSRNAHNIALQKAMRDLSEGNRVDVASIAEPASFTDIPGRRNLISQAIDEVLAVTDEGATARSVEVRALEESAAQVISRGERKTLQSEIANSERNLRNLSEEKNSILAEKPSGSGRKLAQERANKQSRLRDIEQRINETSRRLDNARATLAPHEPGGANFEARAELARRQQEESNLNAQALSYYKTAEVLTQDESAPLNPTRELTEVDRQPATDFDVQVAEESLAASPDMLITVLDDDGNPQSRSARELLDEASRENDQAIQDSSLFDVAVACFLRG